MSIRQFLNRVFHPFEYYYLKKDIRSLMGEALRQGVGSQPYRLVESYIEDLKETFGG